MQTTETEVGTSWDSGRRILETRLRGPVSLDDVSRWKDGLTRAVAELPDGSRFKLLVDLHGFAPADLDVHRAMREVVPRLLAAHGMRPAYIDLFDERPELPVSRTREITCIAFANVHHDAARMADYRRRIGRADQWFFTSHGEARSWLEDAVEISQ